MRLRSLGVALAIVAGGFTPGLQASPACAAQGDSAALVVDKGSEVLRLCVEFPAEADAVTGVELIELAGVQHGLSYSFEPFGGNGLAVCMLDGLERSDGACLGTPYWTYWHGAGSGGWAYSSVGASTWTVQDGDIEGWAWGGSSTTPEATTAASVCESHHPPPGPTPAPSPPSPSPSPDETKTPPPPPTKEKPPGGGAGASLPSSSSPLPSSSSQDAPASGGGATESSGSGPAESPATAPAGGAGGERAAPQKPARESGSAEEAVGERHAPKSGAARSGEGAARRDLAAADSTSGGLPPAAGLAGLGATLLLIGAAVRATRRRRT